MCGFQWSFYAIERNTNVKHAAACIAYSILLMMNLSEQVHSQVMSKHLSLYNGNLRVFFMHTNNLNYCLVDNYGRFI